jgi:hypothetical protein
MEWSAYFGTMALLPKKRKSQVEKEIRENQLLFSSVKKTENRE